jgi:pseudaminic acid biosynthesis-associated methylase
MSSETAAFWSGEFGHEYTKRNDKVPWSDRVPFWRRIVNLTKAQSFLDVGTNAGWNLLALQQMGSHLLLSGVDINENAVQLAQNSGLDVVQCPADGVIEKYGEGACDMVITSGVLIHVAPQDLARTMRAIADVSSRWVVAIEYDAINETEVEYRGHKGRLWKRPYGELYMELGLELVETGEAEGFDACQYWILSKP